MTAPDLPSGYMLVGNYLDPNGHPVIATRMPDPSDKNVVGGYASARAWTTRWIRACADVEVFTDGDNGLKWDHGKTRLVVHGGQWIVWDDQQFRIATAAEFESYQAVPLHIGDGR